MASAMTKTDTGILMTPGPVPYRVEEVPVLPHTHPLFRQAAHRLQEGLAQIFGGMGFTAALTGSGSWGAEVAGMNFANHLTHAVVLRTGLFGDRMAEMFRLRGAVVHVVEAPEGRVPWDHLKDLLITTRPTLFGFVHVDTSTGIALPHLEVAEFIRTLSPDTLVILDAVASAGTMPLELDGLVDYAFTASQKGLEAPAGLAPIMVSSRALAWAKSASWYGDLKRIYAFWEKGEYHHTPSVPLILALEKAVERVLAEGLAERKERSERAYRLLREKLAHAFDFPPEAVAAPTVAVLYPKCEPPEAVLRRASAAGFHLAPGIGPTAGKAVRVGLFGRQAEYAEALVEVLLG